MKRRKTITHTYPDGSGYTHWRDGGGTITYQDNDPSLVLDLQFARDAAYASRRGPLPTFTRASQAWCVNSSGIIVPAAINTPRIDYDPTTLACRGLLIEEQRTNLATWSEDLTNAAWAKANTTVSANQGVAPDGATTMDLLAETTANAQHYARPVVASITSGTAYTGSFFIKKGTGVTAPDWVILAFAFAGFGAQSVAFNLSTGSFGVVAGALTYKATQYINGVWHVAVTAVATSTSVNGCLFIALSNNANTVYIPTYVGQTTSDIFVWGAQFEAGAFATSYIPTTSAAVVRSADVCSITGGAFSGFYNQTEGTLVFRGVKQALQPAATPSYLGVDDGTAGNRIILYGGSAESGLVTVGGAAQATLGGVTQAAALTPFALAMRYKANDFAFCVNGGTVSTDTSGTVPTVTQMLLGSRLGSSFMGGWIQSIQYFNRIKADAQLQALSTP